MDDWRIVLWVVGGASVILNLYLIKVVIGYMTREKAQGGAGFQVGDQSLVEYNAYLKMQHDKAMKQVMESGKVIEQIDIERKKERVDHDAEKRALRTEYYNSLSEINRLRDMLNARIKELEDKLSQYE